MKFNENLRELRIYTRKNIKDTAKELNISPELYGAYEKGKSEPNIKRLKEIAKYYGVSVDYLVGNNYKGVFISKKTYQKIKETKKELDITYKTINEIVERNTIKNEEK